MLFTEVSYLTASPFIELICFMFELLGIGYLAMSKPSKTREEDSIYQTLMT